MGGKQCRSGRIWLNFPGSAANRNFIRHLRFPYAVQSSIFLQRRIIERPGSR